MHGFDLEFQVADSAWQRGQWLHAVAYGSRMCCPRPFRFEKGLRSFAGRWYFATTDAHGEFESRLELDHLMLMDFDWTGGGLRHRSRSGCAHVTGRAGPGARLT